MNEYSLAKVQKSNKRVLISRKFVTLQTHFERDADLFVAHNLSLEPLPRNEISRANLYIIGAAHHSAVSNP